MGSTSEGRGRANGRCRFIVLGAILGGLGLGCGSLSPRLDPGGEAGLGSGADVRLNAVSVRSASEPGPLRIGTSGDYTPFSHWPADAPEPVGFSAEVARAYARSRGRSIQWVQFRWPDLTTALESGRFDLALSGITLQPDRSLAGRFSLPLTRTGAVVLVPAASDLRERVDLDRPGLRIAVNHGGHLERVARTLFARAVVDAIPDNASLPQRLREGRADAVLTDDLEAPHWQRALPGTRAIGPLTRDTKAAWFPVEREPLARDFDRWLLEFEASGGLASLRARHGFAEVRTAAPIPALLAKLDERLALMSPVAHAKAILALSVGDGRQEARVHESLRRAIEGAAVEFETDPPSDTIRRRFVDALLRAARFVQERELAARTSPSSTAADAMAMAAPASAPVESPTAEREAARTALEERIRPAIAFVSERIAWLVVAARASSETPTPGALAQALARHALPTIIEAELDAALADLLAAPVRERLKPPRNARTAAPTSRAESASRDKAPSA